MSERIFKRKAYEKMVQWKTNASGRSALLIEGARRVGKSTLARNFAQQEYDSYLLLDFANLRPDILELIVNNITNIDYLFVRLQVIYNVVLKERKPVIIFDEVQLQPLVRQAIKYLVADGRYDYIETGSLISIRKNVQNIVIPSEEERIQMFPMDYEEFCWALGNDNTMTLLRQMYDSHQPLGDAIHRQLMTRLPLVYACWRNATSSKRVYRYQELANGRCSQTSNSKSVC